MARIADIEGIGPAYTARLREAGIRSTTALLDRGGTAQDRVELGRATGIEP